MREKFCKMEEKGANFLQLRNVQASRQGQQRGAGGPSWCAEGPRVSPGHLWEAEENSRERLPVLVGSIALEEAVAGLGMAASCVSQPLSTGLSLSLTLNWVLL